MVKRNVTPKSSSIAPHLNAPDGNAFSNSRPTALPVNEVVGAILCGGQSSRMGRPKMLIEFNDGQTMLEKVIANLQEVCGRIVLLGWGAPHVPHLFRKYKIIADLTPGRGPISGIHALLGSGIANRYLIVGCDQPLLDAALLRQLIDRAGQTARYFHDSTNETGHALPLYLTDQHFNASQVTLNSQDHSLQNLIRAIGAESVPLSTDELAMLANFNTEVELQRAGFHASLHDVTAD